ncbi:MAG: 50S ribosomal protein L17 [candidate division Zixibacteria bacterium]|nr:50S ribosomal protein L17 [candidate division Zixibacteria bacterium]
MGHRDKTAKLGRTKPHREAMLSNMAMSLLTHRIIRTTDAKAKALKPVIDRIISTAKKNDLSAMRQVAKKVKDKKVFKKLFEEIVPQFEGRHSGFSRILKLGVRRGDGAPMSIVELLIEAPKAADKKDEKGKKSKKAVAASKSKPAKTKKAAKTK